MTKKDVVSLDTLKKLLAKHFDNTIFKFGFEINESESGIAYGDGWRTFLLNEIYVRTDGIIRYEITNCNLNGEITTLEKAGENYISTEDLIQKLPKTIKQFKNKFN